MKTNKIILVLVSCVVLLTVFCVNCFAFFPGAYTGNNKLFNASTAITPERLSFDDLRGTDELGEGMALSIPFSEYYGEGDQLLSSGDHGISVQIASLSDWGSSLYECDIDKPNSLYTWDCYSITLSYAAKNISYSSVANLVSYITDSQKSFFPAYLSVEATNRTARITGNIKIYNGEKLLYSTTVEAESAYSTSAYPRLIQPWCASLVEFLETTKDPTFYYTLAIEDLKLVVSDTSGTGLNWSLARIGIYKPALDDVPEGITFRSITSQETEVKYDLNPLQFLFDTFSSFFSTEIFMGVTLGHLFIVAIAVPALAAVLKAFGGK